MKYGNPFEEPESEPEDGSLIDQVDSIIGHNFCVEMEKVVVEEVEKLAQAFEEQLNKEMGGMFDAMDLGRLKIDVTVHADLSFIKGD